jgi:hypothetical protein
MAGLRSGKALNFIAVRRLRQTRNGKKKRSSMRVALNPPKEEGGGDKPRNAGGAIPVEHIIARLMVQRTNFY